MTPRSAIPALALAVCFWLCGTHARAGLVNLIVNGDFEQGNTGFTSQYTFGQAGGALGAAGSYDVLTNPKYDRQTDINPPNYGDHTTGTGLMFAANGAENASTIFWSETLSVVPNSNYAFSMWISSWFGPPVAVLDLSFNGVSIGDPSAPSSVGVWQEFSTTWNSGAATTVTIDMRDLNLADIGSDFAMDDLSLYGPAPNVSSVPEPSSIVLLLTGLPLLGMAFRGAGSEGKGRG